VFLYLLNLCFQIFFLFATENTEATEQKFSDGLCLPFLLLFYNHFLSNKNAEVIDN